jgi:heat-inducible transcriptional repressor
MAGSSLVFKKIVVNGKTVGAVGVIGPCRMDYSKVVSAIRYLSDGIANAMHSPAQIKAPDEE